MNKTRSRILTIQKKHTGNPENNSFDDRKGMLDEGDAGCWMPDAGCQMPDAGY